MNKQTGLTLIEMMISLAILAIMITTVAPSIQSILIKNRAVSEINELGSVIQFARNNAIDEQINTIVCPSADFSVCSTNWNDPKIVFVDADNNAVRGAGEDLLVTSGAINATNLMISSNNILQFSASGEANANIRILLCHEDKAPEYARALFVTLQGRVKMSGDSDKDGVNEDLNGNALSCL